MERRPIADSAAFGHLAEALSGDWSGTGHGIYPTIEDFDYRERFAVVTRSGDETLRYEQRAWRQAGGKEVASHWEVGLIWPSGDGRITFSSAQGGRTEVLSGFAWQVGTDAFELELKALEHGHDPRMRAASRYWRVNGDRFEYEMSMATDRVPELTLHLRARLTRDKAG